MKKLLSGVLVLIMVAGLVACGSTPQTPSSTADPGSSAPSITLPGPGTSNNQTPPSAADSADNADPDAHKYGGVVKMVTSADTTYPFGLPWNSAINFATQVIVPYGECLVLESTSGDIYPWLATEWETDVEKEEVRLKLRDDVYFSDGSKFNADVVEWNFIMSKEKKALNPAIDRVEKRGEYEVAVIMANGFSNFTLNLLASHSFAICSKENYEKNGEDYAGENPVGTGPFVMTQKVPGAKVVYARNDNYWLEGRPFLDGFEFHNITDVMTQNAALLAKTSGDRVDVLNNGSGGGEQMSVLDADPDLTVWAFPNGVSALYPSSINEDSPFAKKEVRDAVSYAIDRQSIADARGFGYLKPATQIIVDGYYGHFDDGRNYYSYDPEKSKELLAAAGYPDGFRTNYYAVNTADQDIQVAIIDMLKAVGIEVDMEFPESARFNELRNTSGWEGLMMSAFSGLASLPSMFRLAVDPAYAYNKSAIRPEGYDEPFNQLRLTTSFDNDIAQQCHELLADNTTLIPILQSMNWYCVRNSVKDAEYGYWGVGTQWMVSEMWLDE